MPLTNPTRRADVCRQTCKACQQPDKFDFSVTDELWARVVPEPYLDHVVCLYCFDEFAREAGVPYADAIGTLYFAGDRAILTFQAVRAVDPIAGTSR